MNTQNFKLVQSFKKYLNTRPLLNGNVIDQYKIIEVKEVNSNDDKQTLDIKIKVKPSFEKVWLDWTIRIKENTLSNPFIIISVRGIDHGLINLSDY